MNQSRRRILHYALAVATLAFVPHFGWAQGYPERPITLVVFVPAGGAPDIVGRIVGNALSQRLGQTVVINNRPGGGGSVALRDVARAPADGYTLLLVATPHAVDVTLNEKRTNNVLRDIEPVASLGRDAFVMVVNPSFPAKTVPEFIAYAKSNPGKINMASGGTAALGHLSGELFKMLTGIETVHVPFRGMPAANAAVISGDVQVLFDALPSVISNVESGRLRALGVTSENRAKILPKVPAIVEYVPGYIVNGWLGVGAPKGTPPEIVDKLNREINAVLADPEVVARFAKIGSEPFSGSPAEFGKFVASEAEKWGKVVQFSGLKVN